MSEYHAGCNSGLLKVLNASIGPMCGEPTATIPLTGNILHGLPD